MKSDIFSVKLFLIILIFPIFIYGEKENVVFLKEKFIDYKEYDENYLFYNPTSIKIDTLGNIYVVDSNNHRIQIFSKEGIFLKRIGRRGDGPSEFLYPTDIFIKDRILYIADSGNRRVQILDTQGDFKKVIKLNFRPQYIFVNKNGIIYISKLVDVFDPNQEFLVKIVSQEGEIISGFHNATKTKERVINELLNFFTMTMDSKENIIVAHRFLKNKVIKYNPTGKFLLEFKTFLKSEGPFVEFKGYNLIGFTQWIACGKEDSIFLLSYRYEKNKKDFVPGNEIYQFSSSGKYKNTFVLPFNAKLFALGKDLIYLIDEEERLRICFLPKEN